MTEGIKIFEIALANSTVGHRARGKEFWKEIERRGLVPNRSGESMRNFWKEKSRKGLEQYLNTAVVDEDTRFCHNMK